MPSLQQLRYLVAIADTLHFRRAAEACHVTQPTLSGQLRELEARLGVQLVERSRARVLLTPTGAAVAERARIVLRDVNEIIAVAKHDQGRFSGTVRVGVLASLGPYLLPHVLPGLHRDFPDLKPYVREGVPRTLLAGLDDGSLDLLLFPLPVKEADFHSTPLFREPLWVLVPSDHPLAAKKTIARADLKGETVLTLERGHRLHDQVRDICQEFGAQLSLDYEGTSLDTLRQMVGMGMGLSLLPALYIGSEAVADRQVAARQVRPRAPYRMIGMVWRRHSARHDEFSALAGFIRGVLKDSVSAVTVMP